MGLEVAPGLMAGVGKAGIIILIVGVLIAMGIGVTFWILHNQRNKKKFKFLLMSVSGKTWTTIYGLVKSDPQNPSKKKFFFSEYDTQLEIKAPHGTVDGQNIRFITQNHLGELNYLDPEVVVDKTEYLKVALEPEEKAITLHRYKEQQLRFQTQFDKMKTTAIVLGIVMLILVLIAIIFSTYNVQQSSKTLAGTIKDIKEIEQSRAASDAKLLLVAEIMAGSNNGNFTRILE